MYTNLLDFPRYENFYLNAIFTNRVSRNRLQKNSCIIFGFNWNGEFPAGFLLFYCFIATFGKREILFCTQNGITRVRRSAFSADHNRYHYCSVTTRPQFEFITTIRL